MKLALFTLSLALALTACGKAKEAVSQKVAEKVIETAINKDGSKSQVKLANNGMSVSTTDASGQTSTAEIGNAKITEAEVGVAFYPGAQTKEGESYRMQSPDGSQFRIGLHSADALDKVNSFYQEKLKALSAGRQMSSADNGDGTLMLMLIDNRDNSALQLVLQKADKGTDISITSATGKKK